MVIDIDPEVGAVLDADLPDLFAPHAHPARPSDDLARVQVRILSGREQTMPVPRTPRGVEAVVPGIVVGRPP